MCTEVSDIVPHGVMCGQISEDRFYCPVRVDFQLHCSCRRGNSSRLKFEPFVKFAVRYVMAMFSSVFFGVLLIGFLFY